MNYREYLLQQHRRLIESRDTDGLAPISLTEYRARQDRERWRQKYQTLGVVGERIVPPSSTPTASGGR